MDSEQVTNPILSDFWQKVLTQEQGGLTFIALVLPKAIGWVFVAGLVIFMFLFLIGAIQWITSGGDKANLENARRTVGNALVGVIILLSTFAVVKLIESLFGINILEIQLMGLAVQ